MYPRLHINRQHLLKNIKTLVNICKEYNMEITGVTKAFAGMSEIAEVYVEGGINRLGDSRIDNLKKLKELKVEKWLIRPPMNSEIKNLIKYTDVSLNSELSTIYKINKVALQMNKLHKIILMVDLGDLREGFIDKEELVQAAKETEKLEGVHLYGIGVNLTCFSFVQSDSEKMKMLVSLYNEVNENIGRELEIISGGNSATIDLMLKNGIDKNVNNLRLGESLLFGKERANYTFLPNTYQDVFILECQIIEVKEKPSVPWGTIGMDSYGNRPEFTDKGIRIKAICALGKQDFDLETTFAEDSEITIIGASSDHLMVDITNCHYKYEVGDIITLKLGYFSTMRAFTSNYVSKHYE